MTRPPRRWGKSWAAPAPTAAVAGWNNGPTTPEPAFGAHDRLNTTDVPEEVEIKPDKSITRVLLWLGLPTCRKCNSKQGIENVDVNIGYCIT